MSPALVCYAKSLQSCPTLCDPIDGSPPGSPVPGILQARTLEWVAISFSNARKWKVKVKSLSCVRLLATPWIAAYQASPSLGFSKQKYWSGVPLPSPPALVGTFFTTELPWKPSFFITRICWVFVKYIVLWKCLAWTQGTVSMCMCIYLLSYLFIVVSCCKKFMVASNLCEV